MRCHAFNEPKYFSLSFRRQLSISHLGLQLQERLHALSQADRVSGLLARMRPQNLQDFSDYVVHQIELVTAQQDAQMGSHGHVPAFMQVYVFDISMLPCQSDCESFDLGRTLSVGPDHTQQRRRTLSQSCAPSR